MACRHPHSSPLIYEHASETIVTDHRPPYHSVISGLRTKSAKIRALSEAGYTTADIGRILNIRYQHAYNVLKGHERAVEQEPASYPLLGETLVEAGFEEVGSWVSDGSGIKIDGEVPTGAGVYAFCISSRTMYIGSASRSLKQRLYGYMKPGKTQRTNERLHKLIREELDASRIVTILVATPGKTTWNALPVDLSVGLEMGLVRTFRPPWNQQGT